MESFNREKLLNNIIITNQKSIDKLLGLNFDDDFYSKLILQIEKEYSQVKGFRFSLKKLYSCILFSNTYDLVNLLGENNKEYHNNLHNIFFKSFKNGLQDDNRLAFFWNLFTINNPKKLINFDKINPIDHTLKQSDKEKALLFIFSSSLSGASYDLDHSDMSNLFMKLYTLNKLSIENYCLYIDFVGMYQDCYETNFHLAHQAIRKTLANS